MKVIWDTIVFLLELVASLLRLILAILDFLFSFFVLKKKDKKFYVKGMNTEYRIECPECGYTDKFTIGVAHTFDEPIVGYSMDLGYCPRCREPIYRSSHPTNKRGYICHICGSETKEYKIGSKVKLRCPHCFSNKLKVTDLERMWMT